MKRKSFEFDPIDNEEQRLLQQAIENSKKDFRRVVLDLPTAPVYFPTIEEFRDPIGFIQRHAKSHFSIVISAR